jgi:hypothetical protein
MYQTLKLKKNLLYSTYITWTFNINEVEKLKTMQFQIIENLQCNLEVISTLCKWTKLTYV